MYLDRRLLQTTLQGLVGTNQTDNPEYPNIISSLLESRSGIYWNDEHSLLNIENIYNSITNFNHYNYTAFSTSDRDNGEYTQGSKVSFSGSNYEYISTVTSSASTPNPGTDTDVWRAIDELNDFLIRMDYKATDLTIDTVFNHKKVKGQVKSIFNNSQLFVGQANRSDTIDNDGSLVGLKISVKNNRDLVTILHKVGHQFNGVLNDVNLYLYHTSVIAPLNTFTFSHTTAYTSQWTSLINQALRFLSDNHDIGGYFILAYYQDDLGSVKALNKEIIWNEYKRCCDVKKDYERYSPFVKVQGIRIPSTYHDGTNLPQTDYQFDNFTDYYRNYGLNLQFTSKCDLTPLLIQQEELLAQVKSLQMAMLILKAMAFNTRGSNERANQVKRMAKAEIYTENGVSGKVVDRLNTAVKALDFDLSGLSTECLPCNDTLNIGYGSV